MKYAGLLKNDFVNGEDVCVSFWVQGCPFHCKGCHNPQTWGFKGGLEATPEKLIDEVITSIPANGIRRNMSILGGEPLCPSNVDFVSDLVDAVTSKYPDIKIFIWTGYEYSELKDRISNKELALKNILDKSYMLATGPFKIEERDVSLKYIGSKNQKVLYKRIDY